MSLVTSTPPAPIDHSDSPETNPTADAGARANAPTSRVKNRGSWKNSSWRPALCCAGALGLGISLAPLCLRPQPGATSENVEGSSPAEIVLPGESTLVVSPTLPPGALLRGQIQLVADVMGRAGVSGEVARHLVESGARVRRGDAVLEISSGGERRTTLPSESRQNRAEQGQIAAADAQTALAQKMSAAQSRLLDAQKRIARAQIQVSAARNIVRRLQNGSAVAPDELPTPFRAAAPQLEPFNPSQPGKRRGKRALDRAVPSANRIALRQAEAAREAAKASARDLQTAQKTLADAQNSARQADDRLQAAIKNVADVEARFAAKKASGADVEAARAAQSEAQGSAGSAEKAVAASQLEVTKREANAKSSQDYADSSAALAAKSQSAVRPDAPDDADARGGSSETAAPDSSDAPDKNRASNRARPRVTLDQAIRFASAALDESRRASREAERIHAQIEGYQGQVTNSKSRIESATQDLVVAQQKVLDSVPRPRFTTSYAPADGVIMWISRLARQVGSGEAVFGVARGERVAAHFEDTSGLWRALKKDATLPAFVVDNVVDNAVENAVNSPVDLPASPKTVPIPVVSSSAAPGGLAPGAGYPVEVKITEIQSPAKVGAPAMLTAEVRAAAGTGGAAPFKAGAGVLIPMPRPNQKATLSVPASALVQRGGKTYLAVLAPVKTPTVNLQLAGKKTADSTKNEGSDAARTAPQKMKQPVSSGQAPEEKQLFRLDWQRVETGRSDGLRLEITSGLRAGMRVVALPERLEAMGFEPQISSAPKSNDAQGSASDALPTGETAGATIGASPVSKQVSERVMPSLILVHLTKIST